METYAVGFRIFDAKTLQTEDGGLCDPFVVVECCGKKFQTEILESKQQLASFNTNTTWPDLNLYQKQFDAASIEFKVFARNWFTRNYLIGSASLQLAYINKRQNHLYAKKVLCLRKEGDPTVTGYLQVSVYALKAHEQVPSAALQEQEQVETGDEAAAAQEDGDRLSKAVLKTTVEEPPGKRHRTVINIHRVQDLPTTKNMMGNDVLPNPYVTVEFSGCLLMTDERKSERDSSFNCKMTIPVVTPVYEDTIILKLWNSQRLPAAHILMAQGSISFSELRNNALQPRWFNLYGWNSDEMPSSDKLKVSGVQPQPNTYQGRMLISGRVEPLDDDDDDGLEPAGVGIAPSVPETSIRPVVLMADVYAVIGAEGQAAEVELSFGSESRTTHCVPGSTHQHKGGDGPEDSDDDDDQAGQVKLDTNEFTFSEKPGRIKHFLVMAPEEEESQPYVMINVYTYDFMKTRKRIGYIKEKLSVFPRYEPGDPSKPRFYPLDLMPGADSHAVSILISVERHDTEDFSRHSRKIMKSFAYIVRTYCFLARKIEDTGDDTFSIRASCTGQSRETSAQPGPRPKFMKHLDLRCTLYAESSKTVPVVEPIVLTLFRHVHRLGGVANASKEIIASAQCMYTHMRQKDNVNKWEPYVLAPQWVKLRGGDLGARTMAEMLVGFEILPFKFRKEAELKPREMMPQDEANFDKKKHLCKLRKATLHFSLVGLRDLLPLPNKYLMGFKTDQIEKPLVEVEVQWGDEKKKENKDISAASRQRADVLEFHYEEVVKDGDKNLRTDRFCKWTSQVNGRACMNFEFLQTQKMPVLIPDKMILQPYVIVRVFEQNSGWVTAAMGEPRVAVGESRRSLAEVLPCCWFDGIRTDMSFAEQTPQLVKAIALAQKEAEVVDVFAQKTEEQMQQMRKENRDDGEGTKGKGTGKLQEELEKQREKADRDDVVNSTAVPRQLREKDEKDTEKSWRRPLPNIERVNIDVGNNFGKRIGPKSGTIGDSLRKTYQCKYEHVCPDMWFKAFPLLKNRDVIETNDKSPWEALTATMGFVKCAFKLVDGWEADDPRNEAPAASASGVPRQSEGMAPAAAAAGEVAGDVLQEKAQHHVRIHRSYGDPKVLDPLDEFAFDANKLRDRFKKSVPSRIRVRLYLVKAVVNYSNGEAFPDPYLMIQFGGNNELMSFRSQAQAETNEPSFYLTQEKDVVFPEGSRLEVMVMDKATGMFDVGSGDALIGSTVVDLEDRWHSPTWTSWNEKQLAPRESRPLLSSLADGTAHGAIEMWVEMLDTAKAVDQKAAPLVKPRELEIEVRIVIWTTKGIKCMQEDESNVKIISRLDCGEYRGSYSAVQETDVHWNAKNGDAIFNWRLVYPKIKMPVKTCSVQMRVVHHETMGDTDIGSLDVDLKKYIERVAQNMDMIELAKDDLPFSNLATQGEADENIGSVCAQLYVLTQVEANARLAGIGREDPNDYPPLITPSEGRDDWGAYLAGYKFSLPEFGMMKKLLPLGIIMLFFLAAVIALRQMGIL